jgi:hypothetical protein
MTGSSLFQGQNCFFRVSEEGNIKDFEKLVSQRSKLKLDFDFFNIKIVKTISAYT